MKDIMSVENMRNSDATTIAAGTEGIELMYRAARGIFEALVSEYELKNPGSFTSLKDDVPSTGILIVCGSGNNAGDGFALATILKKEGFNCDIALLSDRFSEDGKYYYKMCLEMGISVFDIEETQALSMKNYGMIVDCIFGTGFHGEISQPIRDAIVRMNDSGAFIISADINSGINGNSGKAGKGSVAVKSDITVSIGSLKPGHFLADAPDYMKKVVNCDIGISPAARPYHLFEKKDAAEAFVPRKHNSHKGTFGYVALVGGSLRYSGAIRLANLAQSAVCSGAGVVKLAVPGNIAELIVPHILESTVFPLSSDENGIVFSDKEIRSLFEGVSTIAVGMGIGNTPETEKLVEFLLNNFKGKLIIDADGLNVLRGKCELLKNSVAQKVILTPHPKEFSRISGLDMETILSDPCKAAKDFAKEYNVTLLLKGNATVVCDQDKVYICNRGCPGMATGGSGDVLSGVIAAMVAPKEAPITESVAAAAFVTGVAGEIAEKKETPVSMTASDTVLCIKQAVKEVLS